MTSKVHWKLWVVCLVYNFGPKTCSTILFEKNTIAALHKAGLKSTDNSGSNGKPATDNIWCFKTFYAMLNC